MSWVKSTEYLLKDMVFRLLRIFLRSGRPEIIPIDPMRMKKILFLRHDKIGDLVVSLPVFDNLKRLYPHLELSILCSPVNIGLIRDDPRFANVYLYTKNIIRDLSELRRIRAENFDCVIDLINSDSTSGLFLSQLSVGARPRVGVQKKKFASLYDFSYFHEDSDLRHIIRNTLVVLDAFGIDSAACDPVAAPHLIDSDIDRADKFLTDKVTDTMTDRNDPKKVALIGINLSVGQKTRRWSMENYVFLIKRMLSESTRDLVVIIFTAPADRAMGDEVSSHFDHSVCQIPPGLSLLGASAIVSRLSLFVSPDTSMIHIARSFRVPVVGLYPTPLTNFLQWHPFDQKEGAVLADSLSNISDISVNKVFDRYVEVVERVGGHT